MSRFRIHTQTSVWETDSAAYAALCSEQGYKVTARGGEL